MYGCRKIISEAGLARMYVWQKDESGHLPVLLVVFSAGPSQATTQTAIVDELAKLPSVSLQSAGEFCVSSSEMETALSMVKKKSIANV